MYWLRYTQTKEKVLSPPSSIYLFPSIFFGPIVIVLIGYSPPISVRSIFYFYTYENLQEPLLAITIVLCCFLIGFVPIKISTHTHTRNEGREMFTLLSLGKDGHLLYIVLPCSFHGQSSRVLWRSICLGQ